MGKEGDLWDDSALINAFDDAISKYKIMHGKGGTEGSPKGGKVISSTEENLSAIGDESSEPERLMYVVFKDSSLKGPLSKEVSRKLAELGYHRSAKKCKEKFENNYKLQEDNLASGN